MDKRLIEIQKKREARSRSTFFEKKKEYEHANEAHEKINRKWAEYKVWRVKESESMFDQMENQQVSVKDIQNYQSKIARYKQEEIELSKQKNKKLIERNMAENESELAHKEFKEKKMKHEKFKIIGDKSLTKEKQIKLEKEQAEEEETNELFVQNKAKNKNIN